MIYRNCPKIPFHLGIVKVIPRLYNAFAEMPFGQQKIRGAKIKPIALD